MGRGDKRSKKGKIWRGTSGNSRLKKKKAKGKSVVTNKAE
ncbi:MAG: 30S ribosomal protein THX [Desulfobacterales bacterium]|nr:30S ribosomal protein THX [Desulfobacterales bacterium]